MAAHRDVILNVSMKGTAAAQAAQLSTAFGGVQATMAGLGTGLMKVSGAVQGVISGFLSLKTLIAGFVVGKAVSFFKGFLEGAGEAEEITGSFNRLAAAQGAVADTLINKLQVAVQGTVSKLELMQIANKAIMMGVPTDQLEELAKSAEALGDAVGIDAAQAFQGLSEAIGRGSERGLYALGINLNLQDAVEAYGKKVGKTTEEITEQEKRTIFLNTTMEEVRKKMAALGDTGTSTSDKVQQLGARWKDWVTELQLSLVESGAFDQILNQVGATMQTVINYLKENPEVISKMFSMAAKALEGLVALLPKLLDALSWIIDNAPTVLAVFGALKGAQIGGAFGPLGALIGAVGGGIAGGALGSYITSKPTINNNVTINDNSQIDAAFNGLAKTVKSEIDGNREDIRAKTETFKNARSYGSTY